MNTIYCETAAYFFVITPVYYDSRTTCASTLRVIHSSSFVSCPWLQVKTRNGELDKTERSNDSKMYSHENRIALRWIVRPMVTGQIQTLILL